MGQGVVVGTRPPIVLYIRLGATWLVMVSITPRTLQQPRQYWHSRLGATRETDLIALVTLICMGRARHTFRRRPNSIWWLGSLLYTWTLRLTTFRLPRIALLAKQGRCIKLSKTLKEGRTPLAVRNRQVAWLKSAQVPVPVLALVKWAKVLFLLSLNSPRLRQRVTFLGMALAELLGCGRAPHIELQWAVNILQVE